MNILIPMKQLLVVLLILLASACYSQHKYIVKVKDTGKLTELSSRDYPNDSVAVTSGHLSLWDYYRTGNIVKVVSTLPDTSTNNNFYFMLNTKDSSTAKFRLLNTVGTFNATVNWGDGTSNSYTATDTTVTHKYSSVNDYKVQISFTGSHNLTNFQINTGFPGNMVDGVHNLTSLTELDQIVLVANNLTNIDTLVYPSKLRYLELYDCKTMLTFSPTALSPITKDIDFNHSRSLTSVVLPSFPSTLLSINFSGCNLTLTAVNNLLVYLDSKITTGTGITILLQGQSTPATPTGAGLTAKNSLIAKGASVTTD